MSVEGKKPIKIEKKEDLKKTIIIKKYNFSDKKYLFIFLLVVVCFSILIYFVLPIFLKPNIEDIKDSVVMIETYDENGKMLGSGSGFCGYRSDYIITNFHVIDGAYSIKIITDDKKSYDVEKILIFNKEEDLAILDTDANLKTLKFGKSNNLKAGVNVTAIGSPRGELNTVSTGIVSNADEDGVIRISAPISHGSSGGVLLNNKMKVIGITSAGYDDAQNLNFAIKVERLNELYSYYKKNKDYTIKWNYSLESCYLDELSLSTDEIGLFSECYDTKNIIPSTKKDFYNMTSPIAIINLTSYSENLTDEEKYYVAEMFNLLLKYEPSMKNQIADSEVIENAEEWKPAQLILELDILSRYDLAVYMIEMDKLESSQYFDYINDLDLSIAEKVVLLLSTAGYTPQKLHNDEINEMINWLDDNESIDYDDTVGILRNLGLSVDYETGDIRW